MRNFILSVFCSIAFLCNAQEYFADISEYFYPYMTFYHMIDPNNEKSNQTFSYKIVGGNNLIKEQEVWQGLYAQPVSRTHYKLELSEDNEDDFIVGAILSTRQFYDNGIYDRQNMSDTIVMFALPYIDAPKTWHETQRGKSLNGKSEEVFLSLNLEGENQVHRGVKITKTWQDGDRRFKQWSYWIPRISYLSGYMQIDDEEPVLVEKLITFKVSDLKEISEDVYKERSK